jgi:hypothetical protein
LVVGRALAGRRLAELLVQLEVEVRRIAEVAALVLLRPVPVLEQLVVVAERLAERQALLLVPSWPLELPETLQVVPALVLV